MEIKKLHPDSEHENEKTPIILVKFLNSNMQIKDCYPDPSGFDEITLIKKKYLNTGYDLIYAQKSNSGYYALFLGYWNDGVV